MIQLPYELLSVWFLSAIFERKLWRHSNKWDKNSFILLDFVITLCCSSSCYQIIASEFFSIRLQRSTSKRTDDFWSQSYKKFQRKKSWVSIWIRNRIRQCRQTLVSKLHRQHTSSIRTSLHSIQQLIHINMLILKSSQVIKNSQFNFAFSNEWLIVEFATSNWHFLIDFIFFLL